jgi:hypothetical protein
MVILFVSGILFHFDCWFFLVATLLFLVKVRNKITAPQTV